MKTTVLCLLCGAALVLTLMTSAASGQPAPLSPTPTPPALPAQAPSPVPPPRLIIDKVRVLVRFTVATVTTRVKNGRTMTVKHIGYVFEPASRFHYAAVSRFMVTYHTVNTGSYVPTGVLRITTPRGTPIFHVRLQPAPAGKPALQAEIHPLAEQYVGPLVAHFTLRLGPARAARSLDFYVDRNGPPCTNPLYHCPILTVGGRCRNHLSLSENAGRPTFAVCQLAGSRWYPHEGVVIRYSLSLGFIPERAGGARKPGPGAQPPGVTCLSKRTSCRHIRTDGQGRFAPFWVRFRYVWGDVQQSFTITAYGDQTDKASAVVPYVRVVS